MFTVFCVYAVRSLLAYNELGVNETAACRGEELSGCLYCLFVCAVWEAGDCSVSLALNPLHPFSRRLCGSYPQEIIVPAWITDKELESVASFRSWKRIPAVVYR